MTVEEYARCGLVVRMVDGEKFYYNHESVTYFEMDDKLLKLYKEDKGRKICVGYYNVKFVKYIKKESIKEE